MTERLVHTADGRLRVDRGPINRNTPLSAIELDNEEELLRPYEWYLESQRNRDRNHYFGPHFEPRARNLILNFYRRAKKLNVTIVGIPHFSQYGYIRGRVEYPDGQMRRWGSKNGLWYVDK